MSLFLHILKRRMAFSLPGARRLGVCAIVIIALVLEIVYPSTGGVLLLGLAALSYLNYRIGGRDVLYPAFMYTAIWTLVAAASYTFCPIPIDRIGLKNGRDFSSGRGVFQRRIADRQ